MYNSENEIKILLSTFQFSWHTFFQILPWCFTNNDMSSSCHHIKEIFKCSVFTLVSISKILRFNKSCFISFYLNIKYSLIIPIITMCYFFLITRNYELYVRWSFMSDKFDWVRRLITEYTLFHQIERFFFSMKLFIWIWF